MISKETFGENHIRELQIESKVDPGLIERTLYAFGLLEALARVGLSFIFKGGTSLLLLFPSPKRLSTDIDIIVEPGTDIDSYIEKASHIFPFTHKEEQVRVGKNNIIKRHFKFTYNSPLKHRPLYILLDVLFEANHYERVISREIQNDLLLTEGGNLSVLIPSADCILGDKLTAFAPYTTGIPLRVEKDMEVIKQFYDICMLIDVFQNYHDFEQTYFAVSDAEIRYRGNGITSRQALEDTIQAAVCIGSRGKVSADDFPFYVKGTRDVLNHIYERPFSMEIASVMAPKVIYLAACLLTGTPFERVIDYENFKNETLTQEDLMTMKAFRKLKTTAYTYLVMADRLLSDYRKTMTL